MNHGKSRAPCLATYVTGSDGLMVTIECLFCNQDFTSNLLLLLHDLVGG